MAGEANSSAFRTSGLKRTIAGGLEGDNWATINNQMAGGPPAGNPTADNYAPGGFTDASTRGEPTDNYSPGGFKAARPGKNSGYGS